MKSELHDASKAGLSMTGYALLQWGFRPDGFPTHSVQLPESVIDHVLAMRDECEHRSHAQAEIERLTAENERMGRQLKRIKAVVPEGLTVMADELQRVRDANPAQKEHDDNPR